MSYKTNIDSDGRNFIFHPAGDNSLAGTSLETALADPYECIARINALVPPVDSTNRASLTGSGIFNDALVVPRFVALNGGEASIITSDPINIECGGDQTIVIGSLLNFSNNGILVKVDGKTRVKVVANAMVPNGDDSVMFEVTGACDDCSFELTQGELRGERSAGINHTATSPTPIRYDIDIVEFFDIDQSFIKYNPAGASSESIVNLSACQPDGVAVTTGSCVIDVISGRLVLDVEEAAGESFATIGSGGGLTAKANKSTGKTLIKDGGEAVYKTIGIHTGDIETQGTGQILADIAQVIGDIDINDTSTLVLDTDLIVGDLTIAASGRYDGVVHNHIGVLTNNGTLNGIIMGIRYGNWQIRRKTEILLSAGSTNNQNPVGTDNPLQVEFGPAQFGPTDPVQIDASGNITINETGQYIFNFSIQYGRTGAGGVSWLFFRLLLDGSQAGNTPLAKLDNANSDLPNQFSIVADVAAGQVVTAEMVRDSQGHDSGGLVTESPTLGGWNDSPSAYVLIERSVLQ